MSNIEWIPRADPLGRVEQFPAMATMVADGMHIGGRASGGRHADAERCPADLDMVDIVTGKPVPPLLRQLIDGVSRPLWDVADAGARQSHPQPLESPQWSKECVWVASMWHDVVENLDEPGWKAVLRTINQVWSRLAQAIALTPPVRDAACPKCGGRLRPAGDMLVCVEGHEQPGPERLAEQWLHHAPMTTRELCEALPGLTSARVRQWAHRRKIRPDSTIKGAPLWWPWDAIRLLWPQLAEEVETSAAETPQAC